MMRRILVPPIKSQGIKTKLIPLISSLVPEKAANGRWIEPFMGTGVVGFNLANRPALMADANPHLVNFYSAMAGGEITGPTARAFLATEGEKLAELGEAHFYSVRQRFNETHQPLDFLFLNRSCFNGMIRFNKKGGFNVPFCRKPERFAPAYITKISNQVRNIGTVINHGDFTFLNQDFATTISQAKKGDIIYCDPPYIGRHVDYFNGWTEKDEHLLKEALSSTEASFILSTWSNNDYRSNEFLATLWADYPHITREHFYHVGANIENRRGMTEALVYSPDLSPAAGTTEIVLDEGDSTLF
jgi:DNA adenine methylase